jgi:hypothetical protein
VGVVLRHRRALIWGVVAISIATAVLLVTARPGRAQESTSTVTATHVIDTGAPVDPGQCTPCHVDLSKAKVPGLIFSHGNHLIVACSSCHVRMPHREGATERVPMEVCFACHGIQHGPQGELATAKCSDCHTPSFNLRPADHGSDYAGAPHAQESKRTGVNPCMMCHTASKDCNDCHVQQNVKISPLPDTYNSMVASEPLGPSIKIDTNGPTTMSQCQYCHPDLDAIPAGRLIFAHEPHLKRDYACDVCHPTFGHSETGPVKPDMLSCYRCHGLWHQGQGLVATEECAKCHPPEFDLIPPSHTQAFARGEHKVPAEANPAYCAQCHQSQFCVDCHQGYGTGPNAPTNPVIPKDHLLASWQAKHGKLYLARKGACGSCHDDASCRDCHKTVMPHPPNWIQNHKPPPGITAEDCNICHTDRRECQNCHHQKVRNVELIPANCVPCHPEMATIPPTSIKTKGAAEHAVHFYVTKPGPYQKPRPYRCYECHIELGSSKNANNLELQQGHDLRLCYSCHGALNPLGNIIAPYKGAELCLRCHTNLDL